MAKLYHLDVKVEDLKFVKPFAITGHVFDGLPVVVVRISDGTCTGIGEAAGVFYLQDDVEHIVENIESIRGLIEAGLSRVELQSALPAGGARNALDCAFWDLEAKQSRTPVWKLAGLDQPHPLLTTMTAGADDPDIMVQSMKAYDGVRAIKLKLTGEANLDVERVRAVRNAFPEAWIGVDANQGYSLEGLHEVMPEMVDLSVKLFEQPLPRGSEEELRGFQSPIPIAADESVLAGADLDDLVGLFDVINIKLDKCGGLTEGLAMARKAERLGFKVMVGNMANSSWGMAPAYIVGQLCDIVDLDGPLGLSRDRPVSVEYRDGLIHCSDAVWGGASDLVPASAVLG